MIGGIRRRIEAFQAARKLATALHHASGPPSVALAPDAAGAVILAKDAGWYLRDCLDHHFALGVTHAVVIDAGSTDDTAAIATADRRVTLLTSRLRVGELACELRTAVARKVFSDGWILFAEPEELAEPPAPLARLLSYANAHGFTAILGQILDMAPGASPAQSYAEARATGTYTTQGLEWVPYGDPSFHLEWFTRANRVPDPGARMLAGGMRKLVFGEDPILSKHVLVRNLPEVELMSHPHCASNVTIADVTIAMRRYMFADDWQARDRAAVAAGTWQHGEDRQRLKVDSMPGFQITIPNPQEWRGTDALLRDGFLYASKRARSALSLKD